MCGVIYIRQEVHFRKQIIFYNNKGDVGLIRVDIMTAQEITKMARGKPILALQIHKRQYQLTFYRSIIWPTLPNEMTIEENN